MKRSMRWQMLGGIAGLLFAGFYCGTAVGADHTPPRSPTTADEEPAGLAVTSTGQEDTYTTETLRGRVVWLADALARLYDVRTTRDAQERVLALETTDGDLIPLIEDRRGRSFRKDQQLLDRQVELLVRRYEGVPLAQVIRTYAIEPDGKYLLDYWCDICSISMVELGPCDCCQAPNELRMRKVGATP